MSSLIPFENRRPIEASEEPSAGAPAPIVEVSAHRGRSHSARRPRRARRAWDPSFHVDLLTF